jgi:hypothetical protein
MIIEQINWRQFRSLVATFMKINSRGRSTKSANGRALSIILSYGLSSSFLGISLIRPFYAVGYIFMTITVTMYLSLFTVLSSYSMILLEGNEQRILSPLPVSRTVLFLSRIANLILHSVLVGAPFSAPLVAIYFAMTRDPWSTAAYAAVLLFCAMWTTAMFIIAYNAVIVRVSRNSQFLTWFQILLVFALLFFFQTLPSFTIHDVFRFVQLTSGQVSLFPPHWFLALHGVLTGAVHAQGQTISTIAAIGSTLLLALALKTKWMLLPDLQESKIGKPSAGNVASRIDSAVGRFSPRRARTRAGFDLFRALLRRDRNLRFQLIPVLMMPIAVATFGLLSSELSSPFQGMLLASSAKMHIPTLVFLLFSARHTEQTIRKSVNPSTLWLLRLHEPDGLEQYSKGIIVSILALVVAPQVLILLSLFLVTMPPVDALLQALFLLVAAGFQTVTLHVLRPRVPFTGSDSQLASMQRFGQIFLFMPYFVFVLVLHILASGSPFVFIGMLAALATATILCLRLPRRGAYRIAEAV